MTTIVVSWPERVMVSDSKTTDGDVKWRSNKVDRIGKSLIGCAGDCSQIELFLKWFRKGGRKPKLTNEFNALELDEEGIWLWDKSLTRYPPGQDYHAIGTGAKAALAAFLMGADAVRATEVACEVDDGSGGPLQIHRLKDSE